MIEELWLDANGLRFRALAAGPAGGVPMLLLHGFPEGAESWRPQLEALGAAGYRALAPDLRGYGGTDCPEGEEAYAIEELVADVRGLVEAMGAPAHVAGHDWGSLIGWVFVSQHPDLVRSWAALAAGHPVAAARAIAEDEDQRGRSEYIKLFRIPGKAEAVLAENGYRRLREMYAGAFPQTMVDRFIEGFARPGRLTAALNYYRRALPELTPAMREVATPTILVWGDRDTALGRRQAEITEQLMRGPYALHVLEGAGHWLQQERPDDVSRHLLTHSQGASGG